MDKVHLVRITIWCGSVIWHLHGKGGILILIHINAKGAEEVRLVAAQGLCKRFETTDYAKNLGEQIQEEITSGGKLHRYGNTLW
jgi:HPt (histidine-containing phosphotransfer) domain-containing protein